MMREWFLRLRSPRARSGLSLALTLLVAWIMKWEAGDLMWAAWASSVTFGWAYGMVLIGSCPGEVDAEEGWSNPGRILLFLAFFSSHFLLFHYYQGMILTTVFPVRPDTGKLLDLLLYPFPVIWMYSPVVAATFLSRLDELREATVPSSDTLRMLRPYGNIVRMQVLVFLFLFLQAMGLIRFAVYPVLVLYFFPIPKLAEKLKGWFDRLDVYMNTPR